MDNHIFRGALNGFNRQDVIAYIEKSQKEASERAAKLEQEIENLRAQMTDAEKALENYRQEQEVLTERVAEQRDLLEDAQISVEDITAEKLRCEERIREQDEKLKAALAERDDLARRISDMEGQVESARLEKERVAQLELEARQRAEAVLEEARCQAEEILAQARAEAEKTANDALAAAEDVRKRMEFQVEHTAKEYNDMFSSFETVAAHVASELRKMDVVAAQLPINFNHLKEGLAEVLRQAQDRSVTEK